MGYSKQVLERVHKEFEQKRKDAENAVMIREAEMYGICPMLRDIDIALSKTGLKIFNASRGGAGLQERLAQIQKETEELQDDKRKLLASAGKPENYLDIRYSCADCSDTGYAGIEMCRCMKKALAKASYEESGLGAVLNSQGFENFSLNYYSDAPDETGASPRQLMEHILKQAKDYVKKFGAGKTNENLLFIGKTGLGKTHISSAIAKGVIDKGFDVVYDTVSNIVNAYEQQTFGRDKDSFDTEKYTECSLLIVDDLGSEFKNSFSQSVIYNLLNTRINAGKAMIVSTNLEDYRAFADNYDDRINSRLIGSFRTFKFVGEDIRIRKALQVNKKK